MTTNKQDIAKGTRECSLMDPPVCAALGHDNPRGRHQRTDRWAKVCRNCGSGNHTFCNR